MVPGVHPTQARDLAVPARERRRVLLVTPDYHCGMVESAGVWMPLGLAYLAGSLRRAGFEPQIYDAMSRGDDGPAIARRIAAEQPDVVATTACTSTIAAALEVLRAARREAPEALTVIGGVHPTFMAAEVLDDPAVDVVVRGEGEHALVELLLALRADVEPRVVRGISYRRDGGVFDTPSRPLETDLDGLPIDWDLLDWPLYHYRTKPGSRLAITSWARGCTEACTFCSQQKLWQRSWRARDIDAVVAEARLLRDRFGVDTLEVADEEPTRDRARWEAILDRLIAEDLGIELLVETRADDVVRDADIIDKYRAAGVLHVYVGVESVRQDRLDAMRKNISVEQSRRAIALLNDAGIITETSFLLGFPDDTPETVEETVRLSFEYDPDLAFFLAATPWPYADWWPQVADRVEVTDYSRYNLINPIIKPDAMTRDELSRLMSAAFMRFYREKMSRLHELAPDKRTYLMRVAKLLMEESYLAGEVRSSLSGLTGGAPRGGAPGSARPSETTAPTGRSAPGAGQQSYDRVAG
jgi:anaerobic magnesium-protoporphyrin IX monomethyl ester cyclase